MGSLAITPNATTDPAKPAENASVVTRVDTGGRTQVRVSVNPETLADPADPKPEAKKPEVPVPAADKPAVEPAARPTWLPEKFADADAMKAATIELAKKQGAPGYVIKGLEASESGAEVSAAYADFEKKIDPNSGKPAEKVEDKPPVVEDQPKVEPPVETPAAPVAKTDADKAYERENFGEYVATMLDNVGVRAVDLGSEFEANGRKLTPETYAKFAKAGVTKTFLDSYIAGSLGNAQSLAEAHVKEVKTEVFGGEAGFTTVAVWAQANMTKDQHEIYSSMTNSGSLVAAKEAARMLKGWHEKATGTAPKVHIVPDAPATVVNKGYESNEQMMADMSDPRYKMGDKAFHRMVDEKLKHTKL